MPSAPAALKSLVLRRGNAPPMVFARRGFLAFVGIIAILVAFDSSDARAGMILSADTFAVSASRTTSLPAPSGNAETDRGHTREAAVLAGSAAAAGAGALPTPTASNHHSCAAPSSSSQVQTPNLQSWLDCYQALQLPPRPLFDRLKPPRHCI